MAMVSYRKPPVYDAQAPGVVCRRSDRRPAGAARKGRDLDLDFMCAVPGAWRQLAGWRPGQGITGSRGERGKPVLWQSQGADVRVALLEDEPDHAALVTRALDNGGHSHVVYSDGARFQQAMKQP